MPAADPAVILLIYLPTNASSKVIQDSPSTWGPGLHGRHECTCWLLALAWPSSSYCSHLRSKLTQDPLSLSFLVSPSNSIFQINKSFTKHDGPAEWAAGLEDCCLPTLALTSLVHIQKETCGHSFSYKTSSIVSSFSADLRGLHCGIVGKTATCNAYILYRCHFVSQLLHL